MGLWTLKSCGAGAAPRGAWWLEWRQSPEGRGQQQGMKQNDCCRWQSHWPEGKHWGIGFCGPIDHVLKTHLDLMMNVKMFLVPFNSDLLGGKFLDVSCSGIPWTCSWTRRN